MKKNFKSPATDRKHSWERKACSKSARPEERSQIKRRQSLPVPFLPFGERRTALNASRKPRSKWPTELPVFGPLGRLAEACVAPAVKFPGGCSCSPPTPSRRPVRTLHESSRGIVLSLEEAKAACAVNCASFCYSVLSLVHCLPVFLNHPCSWPFWQRNPINISARLSHPLQRHIWKVRGMGLFTNSDEYLLNKWSSGITVLSSIMHKGWVKGTKTNLSTQSPSSECY